jgi:hypothetical protein
VVYKIANRIVWDGLVVKGITGHGPFDDAGTAVKMKMGPQTLLGYRVPGLTKVQTFFRILYCCMSSLPHLCLGARYEVCKKGKTLDYHQSV